MIANIISKIHKITLLLLLCYLLLPINVYARTIYFHIDMTPIEEKKTTIYDLYTEEEIQLLFKTVETETFCADYESKKNVASVIFNRQELYGKNLKEIITAPNQFSYNKTEITDSTIKACEDALNNRGNVSGALYFRSDKQPETWNGRPFIYTDDVGHNFY